MSQDCSEFIRVYSRARKNISRITSESVLVMRPEAIPSPSRILVHCVSDVNDLNVITFKFYSLDVLDVFHSDVIPAPKILMLFKF